MVIIAIKKKKNFDGDNDEIVGNHLKKWWDSGVYKT